MTAPRPTLTRDSQGFVVLYVGRGKEASLSTQLYCPMLGDEIEVDHAQLAKDLGKLVEEGQPRNVPLFVVFIFYHRCRSNTYVTKMRRQNRRLGGRRLRR